MQHFGRNEIEYNWKKNIITIAINQMQTHTQTSLRRSGIPDNVGVKYGHVPHLHILFAYWSEWCRIGLRLTFQLCQVGCTHHRPRLFIATRSSLREKCVKNNSFPLSILNLMIIESTNQMNKNCNVAIVPKFNLTQFAAASGISNAGVVDVVGVYANKYANEGIASWTYQASMSLHVFHSATFCLFSLFLCLADCNYSKNEKIVNSVESNWNFNGQSSSSTDPGQIIEMYFRCLHNFTISCFAI